MLSIDHVEQARTMFHAGQNRKGLPPKPVEPCNSATPSLTNIPGKSER